MGPIGVQEMIAIFVVALILFGPKKLPELGRTLGKALSEFRRAKNELKASFETHLSELEREARLSDLQSSKTNYDYSPPGYQHPYEEYGRSYDSPSPETHETSTSNFPGSSQPSTPSSQGTEQAGNLNGLSASQSAPVEGTVPRSNGANRADAVPVSTEQNHPL